MAMVNSTLKYLLNVLACALFPTVLIVGLGWALGELLECKVYVTEFEMFLSGKCSFLVQLMPSSHQVKSFIKSFFKSSLNWVF